MDSEEEKKVIVPKRTSDVMRYKVEKLMKNPDKPVFIPEKKDEKLPRVFNPPEFIRNIWGSSAGVGSGDFHIYRNMRRRQNAREKYMAYKTDKEKMDDDYHEKLEENWMKAEEKTAKKRAKRLKKKQKQKAKKQKVTKEESGSDSEEENSDDEENETKSSETNTQQTETKESESETKTDHSSAETEKDNKTVSCNSEDSNSDSDHSTQDNNEEGKS